MTGVRVDLWTDPSVSCQESKALLLGQEPLRHCLRLQEPGPAIILTTTNYVQCECVCEGCLASKLTTARLYRPEERDIPHSSQVRFDRNVFVCPTKYDAVRQYQTMFWKNCYILLEPQSQ